MKVLSKGDGDKLLRRIAADVKKPKHVVIAERTKKEMKDEAKQSAISYWMMGWTWDEIETILEDAEYTKEAISFAMNEAQKYAKKVLNDGPFAGTAVGQGIKLINGSIGTVIDIRAEYVEVQFADDGAKARVDISQIDKEASNKLYEAFSLRKKAATKLQELADPIGFSAIAKKTRYAQAPTYGLYAALDHAITRLSSLNSQFKELEESAHSLNAKWEQQADTWKPDSAEEKEFAQLVVAAATQEQEIFHHMEDALQGNIHDSLVTLYNKLTEGYTLSANDQDKLTEYLETLFNDMMSVVEGHIVELEDDNAKLRAYVTHFETFDENDKNNGLWKEDALKWANNMWDSSNKFYAKWVNDLSPKLAKFNEALLSSVKSINTAAERSNVTRVIESNS